MRGGIRSRAKIIGKRTRIEGEEAKTTQNKTRRTWAVGWPHLEVAAHGILEAWPTLEVSVERHLHLEDLADVTHRQRFPLVDGQSLGGADGVFDLATVEFMPGQGIEVLLRERHQINLFEDANTLDEDLEDGLLCALV